MAGIQTVAGIDFDAAAIETFNKNKLGKGLVADLENVAKKVASMDYGSMNWCVPDDIDPASKQGREVVRETKTRIGQAEFCTLPCIGI